MKDELTITCKRCNKVRILVMDTNKISMCSCGAAVCPYCGSTFYCSNDILVCKGCGTIYGICCKTKLVEAKYGFMRCTRCGFKVSPRDVEFSIVFASIQHSQGRPVYER